MICTMICTGSRTHRSFRIVPFCAHKTPPSVCPLVSPIQYVPMCSVILLCSRWISMPRTLRAPAVDAQVKEVVPIVYKTEVCLWLSETCAHQSLNIWPVQSDKELGMWERRSHERYVSLFAVLAASSRCLSDLCSCTLSPQGTPVPA